MAEFTWHLMAEELPEYGKRNYLVIGPKGGLKIARGFREGVGGPFGAHFHTYHNGYGFIDADEVYAWVEIPPLEDE